MNKARPTFRLWSRVVRDDETGETIAETKLATAMCGGDGCPYFALRGYVPRPGATLSGLWYVCKASLIKPTARTKRELPNYEGDPRRICKFCEDPTGSKCLAATSPAGTCDEVRQCLYSEWPDGRLVSLNVPPLTLSTKRSKHADTEGEQHNG